MDALEWCREMRKLILLKSALHYRGHFTKEGFVLTPHPTEKDKEILAQLDEFEKIASKPEGNEIMSG